MRSIRYNVHFPALIVATLIFWFVKDLNFPARISNFLFLPWLLMGALHATRIVVSLRDRKAVNRIGVLCFVALAALWSVSTPIVTPRSSILLVPVLDHVPQREIKLTLFLLVGSAIGGSGYWLLIRLFWLKSLPLANWLRTIALCMAATLLAIVAIEVLRLSEELTSFVLTIAWWFGFSISLYWSEMSRTTNGPAGAIENLSWKHVTS